MKPLTSTIKKKKSQESKTSRSGRIFVPLVPHLFGVIVHHAGRVVHSQADLIVSLAGLRPPQPDLVFPELAGDVGDDLAHVQPLSRAVISSEWRMWKDEDKLTRSKHARHE